MKYTKQQLRALCPKYDLIKGKWFLGDSDLNIEVIEEDEEEVCFEGCTCKSCMQDNKDFESWEE